MILKLHIPFYRKIFAIPDFRERFQKCLLSKYSSDKGKAVSDPSDHRNVLLGLVGKKEKEVPVFACPQQTIWATDY
jgi:hypothetical protein